MKTEMKLISPPIAEPCTESDEIAWYCVRTQLKHEHIAAAHLKQIPGVEVFNPQIRLLRSTRQGRRWYLESLFPNYIFLRFALEATWEKVSYAPGVNMVLRFGNQIPAIADLVIEELRREMAVLDSKVLTDAPIEGDEVEIASGAFAGMKAAVTHVLPGKQRTQVLLDVMGRLVPADLSLDLILFNHHNAAQFALPRIEPDGTAKAPIPAAN
jgi:transcriptional antiterminator RfaH